MPERRETDVVLIKSLDTLISTISATNDSVKELSGCVTELVQSEKVRLEKDKQQAIKNDQYDSFIRDNSDSLSRLKRTQAKYDKWGTMVGFAVIMGVLGLLGFNFKG